MRPFSDKPLAIHAASINICCPYLESFSVFFLDSKNPILSIVGDSHAVWRNRRIYRNPTMIKRLCHVNITQLQTLIFSYARIIAYFERLSRDFLFMICSSLFWDRFFLDYFEKQGMVCSLRIMTDRKSTRLNSSHANIS